MLGAGLEGNEGRLPLRAAVGRDGAARAEPAARGERVGRGDDAGDRDQALAGPGQVRQGAEQPDRVRVAGLNLRFDRRLKSFHQLHKSDLF